MEEPSTAAGPEKDMKAIAIREFGGLDKLQVMDLPAPEAGPGEIRLRVKAAGVNPVDGKIRMGLLKERLPHVLPLIPGWDAAGTVDRIGVGVSLFKPGDEVYAYCRKSTVQGGTYADYVTIPEAFAARKPANLSFEQAAAVPLSMLTAWQCLFDAVQLRAGETILVHAAAGGVGGYAVQLARAAGAHVLATASSVNHAYVRELGAEFVIDYTAEDFRAAVKRSHPEGLNVVFDCVGGDVLRKSPDVLCKGGRLVSILEPDVVRQIAERGIAAHYVFVSPNGAQLKRIAEMFEQGRLRPPPCKVLPLEQAAYAQELIETRHTRGKIVLVL